MSKSEKELSRIAAQKNILTPQKTRILWARVTTIKQILIKNGLTTHENFEESAAAMVRDIDVKVRENLARDLGMKEEG